MSTLVNVTKALMLSKIDFGLAIYGHCAKKHLALIQTPYHTTVRRSIRAFPTSPLKVVLTEAGVPSIQDRTLHNTMLLIPTILQSKNTHMFALINSARQKQNLTKKPSVIMQCLMLTKHLNIISVPNLINHHSHPQWQSLKASFICNMFKYQKNNTNNNEYIQIFNECTEPYKSEWEFIYTDGSKSDIHTTFAVTSDQNTTIKVGALPQYCSIYTAEAAALHEAVSFSSQSDKKCIICTDSKSAIEALLNPRNNSILIENIRDILYRCKNTIKIMWVPGHAGIRGNHLADERAKEAAREPLELFTYITTKDFRKHVAKYFAAKHNTEWRNYQHHYKKHNPIGLKPNYPPNCLCRELRTFTRLRIGHTLKTHCHLLNGSDSPNCSQCNSSSLTVTHILDECPGLDQFRKILFGNLQPSNLLKATTYENISAINKFLKLCNITDI